MRKLTFTPWLAASLRLAVLTVCFIPMSLSAQDDLEKPPPIPPETAEDVPIPPKLEQEQLEPTVTIREEEERQIEEYRLNGRLYMVKVTPKGGIPFYYIDTNGDGQLELDPTQRAMNPVQPAYWKIMEWK